MASPSFERRGPFQSLVYNVSPKKKADDWCATITPLFHATMVVANAAAAVVVVAVVVVVVVVVDADFCRCL